MLVIVAGILNLAGCDEHDHKYEVVVLGKDSKDRQDVQLHGVIFEKLGWPKFCCQRFSTGEYQKSTE